MDYTRLIGVDNQSGIDEWVKKTLLEIKSFSPRLEVLDVGAGQKRYKDFAEKIGVIYKSHDFNQYSYNSIEFGLQEPNWPPLNHDYICDVLDIPESLEFDAILLTEVLEHVPDPVAVLKKLKKLVRPGGNLIITVPLFSLAHQAPYWFSSGLSPFWFEYWSQDLNLKIVDLQISGDFIDSYNQFLYLARVYIPDQTETLNKLSRPNSELSEELRAVLPAGLLQSGGFGVFAHLQSD